MWDMNRAYELPPDPLKRPADARIPYRDLPASIATDWTPDLIQQALIQHMAGFFSGSALLTDAIFGDPRVQATLHTRVAALLGQTVRFTPASEVRGKNVDPAKAREACDAWAAEFDRICPRETMGQFLQWGVGLGFGLAELRWDTSEPLWRPYLKTWHPQFAWFNVVTRRYIVSTMDGPMEVVPGDSRWVLYTPNGEYRGWLHGAVRAIAIPWLVRQYAQRDWARYSEVHGIPILKAVVPIGGDAEQKERFIEAASNLGQESVVLCPQGIDGYKYDLDMLEATDRSWEAFQGLMDRCDMSIVLAVLGQNLTTEVKEGSFAAARVHGDVRQTILEHDQATMAQLVYQQIARPWALYNFGDADLAPMTNWTVEPVEDANAKVAVVRDLGLALQAYASAGVAVDEVRLGEMLGVPVTGRAQSPAPPEQPVSEPAPLEPAEDAATLAMSATLTAGPKRFEHINFTPPDGVRAEARRGLDWRAEHGRGGTAVGVARARDLANGRAVSPETARRMASYFARHEVDKQGEGWSPGEDGYPSAGRIAWALWGGDAGQSWSAKLVKQMDAADES
jgi:phage gp29-like protein